MVESIKKRKKQPTLELVQEILNKLERMDNRLKSIEMQQTLSTAAWQRQGTVVEEINKRCMEKLGIKCPLIDDEDNGNNGNNEE